MRDILRSTPCASAIAVLMQIWQSSKCIDLIRDVESKSGEYHDAVLRARADLFHFRPIQLPHLPDRNTPWISTMEHSCDVNGVAGRSEYNFKFKRRFLQDFLLYGSRAAMEPVLKAALQQLLAFETAHANPKAPAYRLHPWPTAIMAQPWWNASRCVPYNRLAANALTNITEYGLLRVNSLQGCYVIYSRLRTCMWQQEQSRCTKWWENRDWKLVNPALKSTFVGQVGWGGQWLQAVDALISECFHLVGNASCPRIVGDRDLPIGQEDRCAGHLSDQASPSTACSTMRLTLSADGFLCFDAGLWRQLAKPPTGVTDWVPWARGRPRRRRITTSTI